MINLRMTPKMPLDSKSCNILCTLFLISFLPLYFFCCFLFYYLLFKPISYINTSKEAVIDFYLKFV